MTKRMPCMLSILHAVAFLAGGATLESVPVYGDESSPPDIQRILKRGELIVSLHAEDAPPFFYLGSKGELKGVDVSLAHWIAKELGVKVKFVRKAKSFSENLDLVIQRKADLAASASYPTLDRAKKVIFTEPYWRMYPVLLINRVQASKLGIETGDPKLLNQGGVKIGVYDSSVFSDKLQKRFPKAEIKKYPGSQARETFMRDAINGNILAAYVDELEERKWRKIRKDMDLYLQVIKDEAAPMPISLAVHWKDQHLAYWLNLFLETHKNEQTLDQIVQIHLEEQ